MNIFALIQLTAWTVYGLWTVMKFGWTASLSDTHYKWKEIKDYERTPFEYAMAFIGILMWPYAVYDYDFNACLMAAGSGFGLCMVGVASQFRDDDVDKIHFTGAALAILFGFLSITYQYGLYWGGWMFGIFLVICGGLRLIRGFRDIYTLIIEHIAFYMICIRLLFV